MFNKLKQFKDLRSQAKQIQNVLAEETITVEKRGITVVMNGNMEVKKITISESVSKESLESLMAECVNETIKKTQRVMAQKMQEMGGFPGLG